MSYARVLGTEAGEISSGKLLHKPELGSPERG